MKHLSLLRSNEITHINGNIYTYTHKYKHALAYTHVSRNHFTHGYTIRRSLKGISSVGGYAAVARWFGAQIGASCVAVYTRRHLALTDINFRDSLPASQHGGHRQEIYMMEQYTSGPNFASCKFGLSSPGNIAKK